MPLRKIHDPWLVLAGFFLLMAGQFVVGSASWYTAMLRWGDPGIYFWRQAGHLGIGFLVLLVALRIRIRWLARRHVIAVLYVLCFVLLVGVLFTEPIGGARRWYTLGPLRFQPSEVAKIFIVVYLAHVLANKEERLNDLRAVLVPTIAGVGALVFLILIEPDLGSTVILSAVIMTMLVVAGLRAGRVAALTAFGGAGALIGLAVEPYQRARILDFIYYVLGRQEPNYQLKQSLLAIGSGGLLGPGLGQGQAKAYFLPDCHTDFIFAIIGEELGLVGTLAILFAFLLLFYRGIRAAACSVEPFARYLALGLTLLLVYQALVHMAVCLGLAPTTGTPLPFISYGGSSLLASLATLGLVINVSQESSVSS